MTHFQHLLAVLGTAAEDCYDSFPQRAQEFVFTQQHSIPIQSLSFFSFSTVFAMLPFKRPRLAFGRVKTGGKHYIL